MVNVFQVYNVELTDRLDALMSGDVLIVSILCFFFECHLTIAVRTVYGIICTAACLSVPLSKIVL
jgi:hypothetical protein